MGVLTCVTLKFCVLFLVLSGATADDGQIVAEQAARSKQMLRGLQKALLQTSYVELAREVLHSGVLLNTNFVADDVEESVSVTDAENITPRYNMTSSDENNTTPANKIFTDNIETYVFASSLPNGTTAIPSPSANPKCVNHTAYMLESLTSRQPWAEDSRWIEDVTVYVSGYTVKRLYPLDCTECIEKSEESCSDESPLTVIDAAGKPGPNIKGFQLFWVGDYKECTDVVVPVQNHSSGGDRILFQGRYCTAVVPLSKFNVDSFIPVDPSSLIRVGLCVPDSCSGLDVTILLNEVLASQNISHRVALTTCQEANVDYDAKAIIALIICCVFLLLMILGTTVDVLLVQMPAWKYKQQADLAAQTAEADHSKPSATEYIENGKHQETQPLLGPKPPAEKPRIADVALLAFSVYTNGKSILKASHAPGSITCIHGIRFISTAWIILFHTFVFNPSFAANSFTFQDENYGLWTYQPIHAGQIAVDTFFTLSGLLVTYLVLKEMNRNKGQVNWVRFYFHRFWRLTPPYAFFMMIYITQFRYLAEGPNWPQAGPEIDQCKGTWWANLLYISNFVKTDKLCMPWTWYLSNDMQFYILSPLLFIPLYRWRKAGVVWALVWLLATMIITGVIVSNNDYPLNTSGGVKVDLEKSKDYFLDVYIKPYCRFGSYVVGMLTGYVLYITKCQVKMNWGVALCVWAMATATGLAVVYGLYNSSNGYYISSDVSALYNACSRPAWALCVAWVIIACTSGYGGPVNTLLSWEAFIPLSRLTYIAYLVHPPIINLYHMSSPGLFYMTSLSNATLSIGFTVASFAVAFILSLASEVPMMTLEKLILPSRKH